MYESNPDRVQNVDPEVYTETRQRTNAFTIRLTPKVKEFVAKGVPMFSRGRATRGDMTRRPVTGTMRYAWSDPKQEGFDKKLDEFRYNFQDKYIDLERIIQAAKTSRNGNKR